MKAALSFLITIAVVTASFGADNRFSALDPIAGTYYGSYKTRFAQGTADAQIRSLGGNRYDGLIALRVTKDGEESIITISKIQEFEMTEGKSRFYSDHPNSLVSDPEEKNSALNYPPMRISGDISAGTMEGEITGAFIREGDSSLKLTKTSPKYSPTLGAKPPKNAIVLFDGESGNNQWKDLHWDVKDGALEVGKGNITTKDSFKNALLHIEFRTPYMPEARGQARGNSGVYLRSVFEVQVLDSFGKFPLESNDCGGIYKVSAPDWQHVNACLPPGEWQTYDITFREGIEAEFKLPTISVMHNGKIVVSNAKVPSDLVVNGTGGGDVEGGFLMLQDHGNPVQFRNIWVQPIE